MKKLSTILLALLVAAGASAQITTSDLEVNHRIKALGIDAGSAVTFSWINNSAVKGTEQSAYEIKVTKSGKQIWTSGKVQSANSTAVKYEGPVEADSRYEWTLKVWDDKGKVSKPAKSSFQTGIGQDWKAEWIGTDDSDITKAPVPAYFRKTVSLKKAVKSATLYATAHGVYEVNLSGSRVGEDYLTPGWTSYEKTLQYQAYDVTAMLRKGDNMIEALVVPGWWSSGLVWGDPAKRKRYGADVALLMQLNVTYTDGSREIIGTGDGWEMARNGEVADATIYDGETIDKTAQRSWTNAAVKNYGYGNLVAPITESVKAHAVMKPVQFIITPKGEKVLDFGQNLVGWERVKLSGEKGKKVIVRHAEVLDKDGNVYLKNLRKAKATSTFVLSGGEDVFEPHHTFYGFRYLVVEGLDEVKPEDFEAVVAYSGFETIGDFNCSLPIINQLQSNISWGFHGNFVDIPTDCPQRDERLGWTGDAEVFFRTASFLGDVNTFFRKWLGSVADDQIADGGVPVVIPNIMGDAAGKYAAGWSDCATIIPWYHYMAYGDVEVLRAQYASMKKWADCLIAKSKDTRNLLTISQPYGDWLFWSLANDPSGKSAVTSKSLIAQCFMTNTLDIVARSAAILGYEADRQYYEQRAADARKAYNDEYVTPNGLVSSDTQTAYVLALHFNMLPEELRAQAAERLVKSIKEYKYHISTGFLGTPFICEVLTDNGYSDVAYKLLLQESCPSWIYPITKGATTIWERWNSINPDGSIIDGMNSFNHYSYGAIGDWLYRSAVGIRETAPGYKTFEVNPHPGGDFTHMSASTKSPYGLISVKWTAADNKISTLEVTVPVGTKATIHTPSGAMETVGSGTWKF